MEEGSTETGRSWLQRVKDRISGNQVKPSTEEPVVQAEPPKVSVKSPLPSRTLGAKPPAWLEQQHKEIAEAREKTEREELQAVAQVPQVPAPEYASEFPESGTEGQPVAQVTKTESAPATSKTGVAKTEIEHIRPGMTEESKQTLKETVGRVKTREEQKKAA